MCARADHCDGAIYSCAEPSAELTAARLFIKDVFSSPVRASVCWCSSSAMIRTDCDPQM